jgi:hypothetical protein
MVDSHHSTLSSTRNGNTPTDQVELRERALRTDRATHYRPRGYTLAACGEYPTPRTTADPNDVDCLLCMAAIVEREG